MISRLFNRDITGVHPLGVNHNMHKFTNWNRMQISFTLDSTVETVNILERIANALARNSGFDEEERYEISVAVREAAANAVLHGNACDRSKKVKVMIATSAKDLLITIADEGLGFNPAAVCDPLTAEGRVASSGRGLLLIRTFMDEVRLRTLGRGTEITLRKHLRENGRRKTG